MADHEYNDDTGMTDDGSVVVRPEPVRAKASIPPVTIVATVTAHGEVTPAPTTLGLETEHARQIRYSADVEDGVRYVEVVDGQGQHIASGVGEAADALTNLVLYLLPPDHPDYPSE